MHDVLKKKKKNQHPSQKFHENFINFEKPPKFSKNPKKLGQMHEMPEKERLRPLPSEDKLDLGRKILKDEVWSEREWFWEVKRQ